MAKKKEIKKVEVKVKYPIHLTKDELAAFKKYQEDINAARRFLSVSEKGMDSMWKEINEKYKLNPLERHHVDTEKGIVDVGWKE